MNYLAAAISLSLQQRKNVIQTSQQSEQQDILLPDKFPPFPEQLLV